MFQRNRAARGGAIASTSLSSYGNTRIEDSRFSENQAHAWGGAIYAEGNVRIGLYRTVFSRNFAIEGGALWAAYLGNLRADACTWDRNEAGRGGAILLQGCVAVDFSGDRAYDNFGLGIGGFCTAYESRANWRSGVYAGNRAIRDGGAFWLSGGRLDLANSTLSHNRAGFVSGSGGAIRAERAGLSAVNSIVVLNRDSQTSVEAAQFSLSAASPVLIDYCCVEGWSGLLAGTASFNADPRFRDPAGADGVARIDIGADEYASPRIADMNCSGQVDFDDLEPFVLALVGRAAYQAAQPRCDYWLADTSRDGAVSFDDITTFVAILAGGS